MLLILRGAARNLLRAASDVVGEAAAAARVCSIIRLDGHIKVGLFRWLHGNVGERVLPGVLGRRFAAKVVVEPFVGLLAARLFLAVKVQRSICQRILAFCIFCLVTNGI
jgi:hypothetical protein